MNSIKNTFRLSALIGLAFIILTAFQADSNTKVPVEKIYTQTDRPFYFPGETIWFKSYVVTENNTASNLSDIANAELISPKGAVVNTLKLSIKDGYAYGDFAINNNWVGGIYTLKVYTNWMRNFGEDLFFTKQITVQKVVQPNLLMDLDFKQKGYGKNQLVTANFEVKDLKNNPQRNRSIIYEVSVKGNIIQTENIKTNAQGKSDLKFTLPKNLETTDVVLNLKIDYKGSTESISRRVPIVLNKIDLQFFPESGNIIASTENIVAFKAIDEFVKPVDVSGDILNSRGKVVAQFSSFHDGMGSFKVSAEKNETYYALLKTPFVSEKGIALPKVQNEGTRFSVKTEASKAVVSLFSSEKEALLLTVSNASETVFSRIFPQNKRTSTSILRIF